MNTNAQTGTESSDTPLTRVDVELLRSKVESAAELDLSARNLRYIHLTYFDLQGANLQGADLQGANLRGARLCGTDLRGARLCGADLDGADLSHARLSDSEVNRVDLHNAKLSHAILKGLDLRGFDLTGLDLRNADLSGTDLRDALLRGAALCGADLSTARLHGSELRGAKLHNVELFSNRLRKTRIARQRGLAQSEARLLQKSSFPPSTPEVAERIHRVEQGLVSAHLAQTDRQARVMERMVAYKVPGLSVAVINAGEVEWVRGYGVLEAGRMEQVTPETIFQVCSISKHVAAMGVLRLVQEGLLDLNEDVNRYLVSWKIPANGSWQPAITLRQLLGHTAGLVYNWYRGFRRGEPLPTLLQVLEGQPPANTPPVRAVLIPGSQFRYSGSHYSVLQQLLIDVTGKPFPELMHELVFEPLEMSNSSYDQSYPNTRPASTAVGHYIGGEPVYGKWRIIPEMAGAGLWTTASDLARLACEIQRAYQDKPARLLGKTIIDQALTPQGSEAFGLGIQLDGKGAARRFGHSGDNIGYKCLSTAYLEHGMGAVVLTNCDDGSALITEVLQAIAIEYAWPDYSPRRTSAPTDASRYDACIGEYELRPHFSLTISRQEDTLLLQATGQPPLRLHPSSEDTFFAQPVHSELTFTRDEAGKITGIILRQEEQEMQAKKVR